MRCRVVSVVVLNTGVMLLVGMLFSGMDKGEQVISCLEEEKGLVTVFFRACKRSALGFPEDKNEINVRGRGLELKKVLRKGGEG